MKEIKRHALILASLFAILVLLVLGYVSGFFFYSGITPCLLPPGMVADGFASATVHTWLDDNRNGIIDSGEPSLPNVEIKYPVSFPSKTYTDDNGKADTGIFKPGCACNCWKGEFVEVKIPDGYLPTTPVRKELSGDNLLYQFGFCKVNP